ncbi:MAG: serine aminopeptidase domain-containing protein [Elusimicrobiota bacterium]
MNREIKESCCRFGERGRLAGVVTEPANGDAKVAVVLVTAGLTPKFGPFRLYAQIARRLAGEGLLALRFDLGGIGDSGQDRADLPLKERTALEIKAAVDLLAARGGLDGIILGGLCSGAEDSFRYAENDPRITGVVLMDPFGYKTLGWRVRDLAIRIARRLLWIMGLLPTYAAAKDAAALIDYRHMDHAESSRILRALIRRNVPMHFVYTGGMRESFNHKSQFQTMFAGIDFRGFAAVDFFPQLRHTQVLEADRRLIVESIVRRLQSRAPRGGE